MPKSPPFSASLDEKARKLGWTPDQFRDWLRAQGYTDKDIEDAFSPVALRAIVQPAVDRLLPKAAALLGWSPSQLESRISIEVQNTDTVECHVALPAGAAGKHVLRVPAGFLFFANKVVWGLANGLLKGQSPPIPLAEEEAAMLLQALYGRGRLGKQEAWTLQPYQLTTQQRLTIAFLSGYIRDAAVAHELGHIVYELGGATSPTVQELRAALVLLLKGFKKRWYDHLPPFNRRAERRKQRWNEEFAADHLAVWILGRPDGGELAPSHGLIMLLLVIEMLEWCSGKSIHRHAGHPPSSARRGLLWTAFPWLANNSALPLLDDICRGIARRAGCKPQLPEGVPNAPSAETP